MSATNTGFIIETGVDVSYQDKLEVTYKVLFESESLVDSKLVKNIATVSSDNTEEDKTEHEVEIDKGENPRLIIEKTSDKDTYQLGETGHYTIKVTNDRPKTTAKKVLSRRGYGLIDMT